MRFEKKMRFVFSMPAILFLRISSLILSLSYSDRSAKASEINVFNLCTQKHCEDCSSSEFSKCSKGAISSRCGDLCGCCHSCVQYRDFGESCGSQLAVRSSENFEDSRVIVLATTSCGKGLICANFICKRLHESENVESNDIESLNSRTNLIGIENPKELYHQRRTGDAESRDFEKKLNENDVLKRKIELPTSTGVPSPITSIRRILSTSASRKNEISSHDEEQENDKDILLDPSGHLINLLVAGREFELIYGHEALADFSLLIKSIDTDHSNSIIEEYEAKILYERFKDVLWFVSSEEETLKDDRDTDSSSTPLKIENKAKNIKHRFPDSIRDLGVMTVLRNFVLRPRTLTISKLQSPLKKFRKKRELSGVEGSKLEDLSSERQREIDERIGKEYGGISIYDVVNKGPRQVEDFGSWLIAQKVDVNNGEKSQLDKTLDGDGIESEINIRITGVPRMRNFGPEDIEMEETNTDFARIDKKPDDNNDHSEILVNDASTDVPKILTTEDKNFTNFTTSEISESQKSDETDRVENVTEDDWVNVGEQAGFFQNNYEFTFPENPVTLVESDYNPYIDVNENVNEIKTQLDRIEARAIIIETAVFDMMEKIDINERSRSIESRETNVPNFTTVEPEKRTQLVANDVVPRKRKIARLSNDNSSDIPPLSSNPENRDLTSEDTRLREFLPNRSNRQWRAVTIQPNLSEAPNIARSEENKIIERKVTPLRSESMRHRVDSDRRHPVSLPRGSSSMKFLRDLPKVLGRRKFPIFLSSRDSESPNFYNYQPDDPRLFSRQQSSLQVTSDSPRKRSVWPFNLVLNRAQPADRGDRKSEERIRIRGRKLTLENPALEKSVIFLETQIPTSLQPGDSMASDDLMAESSVRFVEKYDDDNDDWNWGDEKPSLNLFVADEERSRIPESLILPMGNSEVETNRRESHEAIEGYSIFPAYLDYSERSETREEKDEGIVGSEATELPVSLGKKLPINSRSNRKKRSVIDNFLQAQKSEDIDNNTSLQARTTMNSNLNNSTSRMKKSIRKFPFSTNATNDQDNSKIRGSGNTTSGMKNSSRKRSRRSIQMVDWLRAAQEYQERLRQVRNAALRTWLTSWEELADTNLTNVKLFTSEVPFYLERYKPTIFSEVVESLRDAKSQDYSAEIHELKDSMADASEVLTDILVEHSSLRENHSEPETNERSDVGFNQVSSSQGPRKFTIITSGNSTIRIDEMFNNDGDLTWLEDQLAQGSSGSEVSYEIPIPTSERDYFDHMYESFDADDEDFDYEDPNLTMSGWFDQVDIIESSNVEIPEKNEESRVNLNEKEHEDPSSRFKRDSPLFLFRIKGSPKRDVVVWPSNWRDLIDRHLRLNRSGDTSERTANRSYLRHAKADPKLASASYKTSVQINPLDHEDEIPSSSETVISEENFGKDSRTDLDVERRLQKGFDHRSRQSKRKNGSYRSNIGNYK